MVTFTYVDKLKNTVVFEIQVPKGTKLTEVDQIMQDKTGLNVVKCSHIAVSWKEEAL